MFVLHFRIDFIMLDHTKTLLFVGLMLTVVLLVTNGKRPTAETPIAGSTPVDDNASQTRIDQTDISPAWAANVPTMVHPLALMMPQAGTQPVGGT